jgi:hypothetical protein
MARLKRPYIPLKVRIAAAERQADTRVIMRKILPPRKYLLWLLNILFGAQQLHLDHDPPLMLRDFNKRTGKYTPDANDPEYLVWRTAAEHRIKTYVRGDGAQLSDAGKRRKEIKRRRKMTRSESQRTTMNHFAPQRLKSSRRWPPKGSRKLRGRKMR